MSKSDRSPGNEFSGGEPETPTPTTNAESVRKDMTYSPSSETETQQKQADPLPDVVAEDIDASDVRAVPGTGGPDDVGDVDVDPDDLELPWRE